MSPLPSALTCVALALAAANAFAWLLATRRNALSDRLDGIERQLVVANAHAAAANRLAALVADDGTDATADADGAIAHAYGASTLGGTGSR